jgi:hypothetical protein
MLPAVPPLVVGELVHVAVVVEVAAVRVIEVFPLGPAFAKPPKV